MKPILLKVAGLQSYREQQEIDFESLTETGLFGIFGPTGSGKSSLLDAITLAMYGKVERAANGTQGIMNHSEDTLSVAFTFELTSSAGPRRYRVERKFKRTGEQSVSNTISRFIELTADGDHVMADKLADVTRCVEEHIGLKMDDFTRAVVLPQGKFAEFLSLRGVDRRQMLQRLFHLEQYGDLLAQKLSRRVKENESALRALEAEQQGLGQAGKQDVEAAAERLQQAVAHAEECRKKLAEAIRVSERFAKIRELQEERSRRELQRQGLLAREEEILLLEGKLGKADEAEKRLPALKAWRSAEELFRSRLARAEGQEVQAAAAEQEAARCEAAEAAAQASLAAEEPALRQEEGLFRRALELEAERDGLRRELAALRERRENASRKLAALRENMARERELLAKGQKRQQELQQSLQPLEVRSQERQSLQEAMQRLQGLLSAEAQWAQAEKERRERAELLTAAERRLAAAEARRREQEGTRAERVRAAALHAEQLLAAETAAAEAAARLEQQGGELEAALKDREIHRLSLSLARELAEGLPCPVCGSQDHPAPALGADGEAPDVQENQLQHIRALSKRALEARHLFRSLREQDQTWLEQVYGDGALPLPNDPAAAAVEEEAEAGLTAAKVSSSSKNLPDEAALSGLEQLFTELKNRSGELRRLAAEWQRSFQEGTQLCHKEAAAVEAERGWAEGITLKAEELGNGLAALRRTWGEQFPELAPHEVEAAYRQLLSKDEQAEEIRNRLEISVKFLDDKNAAVQSLQEETSVLDKELAQWDVQLEGKEELQGEKERRLMEWTGGRPAAPLLAECERRLQELLAAAEASRKALRVAADKAQRESKEAAIARQAAESASEHLTAAIAQWEDNLSSSPFASAAEVEAAALVPLERDQAVVQVRSHREEEAKVHMQLRHIEEQLDGASLSPEEWQDSQESLRKCKEDDEMSLQTRARGERDLEDLRQRHIRWMELEEKRLGHELLQDRLSKLQAVLRGNAFVEYIAEEQLMQVCQAASQRLRFLSKQRYALEVDSGGGFVIRDDGNGGVRRPVSTLSGGETFLTSLSLALALSAQIQLRGQYPLQFFFLDEGFGTLDPDLLDTVITSLERLHNDQLSVGIISHVPELRARLPRKLVVVPAEQGGGGSRILLEKM
ncbi:AAA family ATPase [Paenibacillus albidus]|uniref:AAA family ATPase n=1 Tax=Paenibacillus albidus TaxID=2041023 RepID=UPI001BEC6337|nr:AAA family ATPase [Paenibacillus albidus]MBT2288126.1 AAA family ATPase [Paenibacillus albidus]